MADVVQNQGPEQGSTISDVTKVTIGYESLPLVVDHAHPTII